MGGVWNRREVIRWPKPGPDPACRVAIPTILVPITQHPGGSRGKTRLMHLGLQRRGLARIHIGPGPILYAWTETQAKIRQEPQTRFHTRRNMLQHDKKSSLCTSSSICRRLIVQ